MSILKFFPVWKQRLLVDGVTIIYKTTTEVDHLRDGIWSHKWIRSFIKGTQRSKRIDDTKLGKQLLKVTNPSNIGPPFKQQELLHTLTVVEVKCVCGDRVVFNQRSEPDQQGKMPQKWILKEEPLYAAIKKQKIKAHYMHV